MESIRSAAFRHIFPPRHAPPAMRLSPSPFRQRKHFPHARPSFFSGRADNACTNLLGFLVRYVRTRGSMRFRRVAKLPIFTTLPRAARTRHAWLARLTRARGRRFLRGRKALLNDFWYFSSQKSTIKEKFRYVSYRASMKLRKATRCSIPHSTLGLVIFPIKIP